MELFTDTTLMGLKQGLDAGALRQRVIANNIANVNTPFFKKSSVTFESELKKALGDSTQNMITTHPRHINGAPDLAGLRPQVNLIKTTSMRKDGNNVDIDEEMTNLAANGIAYQAAARELSERYSLLGYVITGGRR